MFSGGIAPQQPPVINSSSFFGDSLNSLLFSNPENSQFGLHQLLSQKNKLKRCRQRVDAGEPRNTYHVSHFIFVFELELECFLESIKNEWI